MKTATPIALLAALLLPAFTAAQAKEEKTEVKFVFRVGDVEKAKAALALTDAAATPQTICFFETKARDLDAQKLILRARYVDGADKHNGTTVKLRTGPGASIEAVKEQKWIDLVKANKELGKLEKDQVAGKGAAESLSLNNPGEPAAIKAALQPGGDPAPLFSRDQKDFIAAHLALDWKQLQPVGPIVSKSWDSITVPGLAESLGAEQWTLSKQGKETQLLLEISAKVPASKADDFAQRLLDAMKAQSFTQDTDAATKTRTLFQYFLD